jgi:hypothetical protein
MFQGGNMANSKVQNPTEDQEVEVLYQKLGDRWFAFSIINDEVFMSPITDEEITDMKEAPAPRSELHSL